MEFITKVSKRIWAVQNLAFMEAIRRKLLLFLIIFSVLFLFSGGGCTRGCISMQKGAIEFQKERRIAKIREAQQLTEEQKKAQIEALEKAFKNTETREKTFTKSMLSAVTYTMIGFWLFLLSGIFTPFLAMNDFQNRTHVMILARPVQRWEYLVGRFLAIMALLLVNLLIMLLVAHGLMFALSGDPGWHLLKGLGIFAMALLTFTAMQMFLSLVVGRVPSLFLGIIIVGLGIMPAFSLLGATTDQLSAGWRAFVYGAGYGLPQFSINFLYGLTEVAADLDMTRSLRKVGNNTGPLSPLLNLVWFIVFWAASITLLNRREIET